MSFLSPRMAADPRRFQRHYVNLRCPLMGPPGKFKVWGADVSGNGARLGMEAAAAPHFVGPDWELGLPTIGVFPITRVWNSGIVFGTTFAISEEEQDRLARLLDERFAKRI